MSGWDSAPPTQAELASVSSGASDWASAPPTKSELDAVGQLSPSPDWVDRLSQAKAGIQDVLSHAKGPIGFMANPAVQAAAGKVIDYPFGYLRTGAAEVAGMLKPGQNPVTGKDWVNTVEGNAPGAGDYAVRFGMGNPAVQVPGTNNKQISAQDAVNFAGNVAPLALGEAALRTAPGAVAAEGIENAAGKAATTIAQKTGKALFNIPEDVTGRYIQNPDAIESAPTRTDINDRLLSLKDQSDAQVAKAQDDLLQAKSNLMENKGDVRAGQQDEKFEAQNNANEAQQNFNEKKQAFREALKANNLTNMSSQATQAVADLKEKVVQGSKDAYSILDNEKGSVDVDPIAKNMNKWSDELTINGVPTSNADAQALDAVTNWQSRLRNMAEANGGKLSLPQAKQVIQGLDREVQVGQSAGDFSPKASQALTDLRGQLDDAVKNQSDAYKQKMLEVSKDAQLLGKANDLYGTPEDAISNLNGITSQKGQAVHLPLLKQLGEATGRDLAGPANDYIYNHKVLSTPSLFEQVINSTPEARELAKAQGRLAELSDPSRIRNQSAGANAPLEQKVQTAQAALDSAKDEGQLFKGITTDSVTGKTKQLGGANDYGAQVRFGDIDKKYGTNFENEIQRRNDADAFSKDATRGSRLTVLGGAVGGGIGAMVGGTEGAAIGWGAGTGVGSVADRYGAQAFKGALNKGVKAADLAKTIGRDARQSIAPASVGNAAVNYTPTPQASLPAAASNPPKSGHDKWANDGVKNLIQHAQDPAVKSTLQNSSGAMLSDPKTKQLLIQASDLKPGTKAMDNILAKVRSRIPRAGG